MLPVETVLFTNKVSDRRHRQQHLAGPAPPCYTAPSDRAARRGGLTEERHEPMSGPSLPYRLDLSVHAAHARTWAAWGGGALAFAAAVFGIRLAGAEPRWTPGAALASIASILAAAWPEGGRGLTVGEAWRTRAAAGVGFVLLALPLWAEAAAPASATAALSVLGVALAGTLFWAGVAASFRSPAVVLLVLVVILSPLWAGTAPVFRALSPATALMSGPSEAALHTVGYFTGCGVVFLFRRHIPSGGSHGDISRA
jgi:hypothetical protein